MDDEKWIKLCNKFEAKEIDKFEFLATEGLNKIFYTGNDEENKAIKQLVKKYKENIESAVGTCSKKIDDNTINYVFFKLPTEGHVCYSHRLLNSISSSQNVYKWCIGIIPENRGRKKSNVSNCKKAPSYIKDKIIVRIPMKLKRELIKKGTELSVSNKKKYSMNDVILLACRNYLKTE